MEWSDEGVVVAVRAHGETAAVAELFTRAHGRHAGLVHGGRSRRSRPVLQIGNHVEATWRARLDGQLGTYRLELQRGYAGEALEDALALSALTSVASLLRLLPDRDPHPNLFEITLFLLGFLDDAQVWPALYARWEMALLNELGFGLDLSSCAATGVTSDLAYVSPKSGRAVSRAAGLAYADKLLPLPTFLLPGATSVDVTPEEIGKALRISGYFLDRRIAAADNQSLPAERARLVARIGGAR